MFERIRQLFSRKPEASLSENAETIGASLDYALQVYAELLENECRYQLAIDAAEERIADLREQYQRAKLEQIEGWSS